MKKNNLLLSVIRKEVQEKSNCTNKNIITDRFSSNNFITWIGENIDIIKKYASSLTTTTLDSFLHTLKTYSLYNIIANYSSKLIYAPVLILTIVLIAAFLVLLERRIIAAIHRRQGPNKVGKGYLQPIADALKLLVKENNKPTLAKRFIFYMAPILALSVSLVLCAFLPIYVNKVGVESHYSILYYYAFSSLSVLALIMAGWSSRSKYPLLGTIRACAAIISYEVVISLILLIITVITQSASFTGILFYQKLNGWLFLYAPFLVPLFFIAALAELNRAPFDLTESEAELVAGYNVEYSGLLFAFFILAEYIHVINIGGIIVILFFGGGYVSSESINGLFIYFCELNHEAYTAYLYWENALAEIKGISDYYEKYLEKRYSVRLFELYYTTYYCLWYISTYYIGLILFGLVNFINYSSFFYLTVYIVKVLLFCIVTIVVRAITPRYRYDHLMYICWNTYVPVCLTYLFILIIIIFVKFIM